MLEAANKEAPSAGIPSQPTAPVPLHDRKCPICGNGCGDVFAEATVDFGTLDRFAFASRKTPEYMHWRLLVCRDCDLLYASPAPSPKDLASLYRDANFGSAREARHAARTYAQFLPRIAATLTDLDAALDIGAGEGAFLQELLSSGFKRVVGLEPSSAAIAASEPTIRPLLRQTVFERGLFPPASFDLVTCFQTIEHVSDPLDLCREIHQLLKPDGSVLLVGHNRRAISAKLLGRKSPIFDVEHLQLFSRRSLETLLERSGFRQVRVRQLINQYPAAYWFRLLPLGSRAKRAALRFLERSRLGDAVLPLPAGNLAVLAYK